MIHNLILPFTLTEYFLKRVEYSGVLSCLFDLTFAYIKISVHVLTLVSSISAISSKIWFCFHSIIYDFQSLLFHPVVHVRAWNFFLKFLIYFRQSNEIHEFSVIPSALSYSNALLKAVVSFIYLFVSPAAFARASWFCVRFNSRIPSLVVFERTFQERKRWDVGQWGSEDSTEWSRWFICSKVWSWYFSADRESMEHWTIWLSWESDKW